MIDVPDRLSIFLEQHELTHESFSEEDGDAIVHYAKDFLNKAKEKYFEVHDVSAKRRKLNTEQNTSRSVNVPLPDIPPELVDLEVLIQRHHALFEWIDGPLVQAMKEGHMILLDEMSLAEDAVLERLNSVLEPARTLVLAEKGSSSPDDLVIKGHKRFRLFATMNPGGDFGKRELSPALRSRFTEIWVPTISDSRDIELVLGQSLSISLGTSAISRILPSVLDYIEWFNRSVCEDPQSQFRAFTLSLRDMITWTEFIVTCSKSASIPIENILLHGARMMHLDGLGLGTGGMSIDDISRLKELAERRIKGDRDSTSLEQAIIPIVQCTDGYFGASPFQIPVGKHPICEPPFSFRAQTPATNIQRVLRAMQLPKPILLEGSPGVGKTTLIAALASASGHRLTRINLSEQTDISDLMGTDLPVMEKNKSGSSQPLFRWHDGALLSAIKNGDWVLLDELNLAPQSVLEGLNSCLDHRANVFIPELGTTFHCPPTFRVFAAQNPLGQGGGRKGLPKSFLNRFSKVYVDELTEGDMVEICLGAFATLDRNFVERIVHFNDRLHTETTFGRLGASGSPWEFNLRDIFRFCSLIDEKRENLPLVLSDLYIQRFRVAADRDAVMHICKEYFKEIDHVPEAKLDLFNDEVHVNDVILKREVASACERNDPLHGDTVPFFSQCDSLRAACRCVMMHWPCLLVGNSTIGKTSLVRMLADMVGAKIIEVALSSSSDVSELVGSFEQVDSSEEVSSSIDTLVSMAERILPSIVHDEMSRGISSAMYELRFSMEQASRELQESVKLSLKLLACMQKLDEGILSSEDIISVSRLGSFFENSMSGEQIHGEEGSFVWKDGPLVDAMKKGYWLHLKNANLCPSSVLDRLNPVMEPGGSLFLAEGGNDDGDASTREIFAHPSFRIFLSMDPNNGEVSRAMRNRCVEISSIQSSEMKTEMDSNNILQWTGIKSSFVAQSFHPESRSPPSRHTMSVALSMIRRGLSALSLSSYQASFGLDSHSHGNEKNGCRQRQPYSSIPLLDVLSTRDDWLIDPALAGIRWRARILELSFQESDMSHDWVNDKKSFLPDASQPPERAGRIRDHLITIFLSTQTEERRDRLYLSRLFSTFRRGARWIDAVVTPQKEFFLSSENDNLAWRFLYRVPYLLQEHVWEKNLEARRDPVSSFVGVSVLELSYLVSHGKVGQSTIRCSVLPNLVPYFRALDDWIENWTLKESPAPESSLFELCSHRDALRHSLLMSVYLEERKQDHVCFDTGEFIVQWCWLQKSLQFFRGDNDEHKWLVLEKLSNTIHAIVFETNDLTLAQSSALKWSTLSLIPRKEEDWRVHLSLKKLTSDLVLDREASEILNLENLLAIRHALLFTDLEFKRRALAAFCTFHVSLLDHGHRNEATSDLKSSLRGISETLENELTRREKEFFDIYDSLCIDPQALADDMGYDIKHIEDTAEDPSVTGKRYKMFTESMMVKFSDVQLAPLMEERCETLEYEVIRHVAEIAVKARNQEHILEVLQDVIPQIKTFISAALKSSLWCAIDLVPYQSLVWLVEAKITQVSTDHVLRALLSIMCYNASARVFGGSKILLQRLSPILGLPSLIRSANLDEHDQKSRPRSIISEKAVILSQCFSMFDAYFERKTGPRPPCTFLSIENHCARRSQGSNLLHFLSSNSFSRSTSRPHEILFLTQDVFAALRKSFPSDECLIIENILEDTKAFDVAKKARILELCLKSTNERFLKHVHSVISPLLDSIWNLWNLDICSPAFQQELGSARILCGLLRYQLSIPDSPSDPGQKAIYKISLLASRLEKLRSHLLAREVTTAFLHGSSSGDENCQSISNECQGLQSRQKREEGNVIRRLSDRPDFSLLYREAKAFADGFLDVVKIVDLIKRLKGSASCPSGTVLSEVSHFQSTSYAFHRMIQSRFKAYEDVVYPLAGSISLIQEGFATLVDGLARNRGNQELFHRAMNTCLQFPYEARLDDLIDVVRSTERMIHDDTKCMEDIYCCVLSRLPAYVAAMGVDHDVLNCWLTVVGRLGVESTEDTFGSTSFKENGVFEDKEEQEFREQFPDHRRFFQDILQDTSDDDIGESSMVTSKELQGQAHESTLDQDRVVLLACLHDQIFASESLVITDFDRLRAFGLSFIAGNRLHTKLNDWNFGEVPVGSVSGFSLAVSLVSVSESTHSTAPDYFERKSFDFARDPNPSEVLRAAKPLNDLAARLSQLLSTFPGNSVLLSVLRVVECVRKVDVHKTPWGRVMTGLELVLKNAQDWEQHASNRVKLGACLAPVSQLVLRWRKSELTSWNGLLSSREEKMKYHAKRHWLRLHTVIRSVLGSYVETRGTTGFDEFLCLTPEWITKRSHSDLVFPAATENLVALLKIFDTFCLSSPLGEFSSRLDMLHNFAHQVGVEVQRGNQSEGCVNLALSLKSLYRYYSQFMGLISQKIVELRRPIEVKLQKQVSLAKWDDKTYYAQAESIERNHRSLMKLCREYDEVLSTSIGLLLEPSLNQGIRDPESKDRPCTSIPANKDFFSLSVQETPVNSSSLPSCSSKIELESGIAGYEFISKMKKWCQKMSGFKTGDHLSSILHGQHVATDIYTSIFDRIESLRSKNSTRPMKERALTDLLRELKLQGYATTKWSLPSELREIEAIFQSPSIRVTSRETRDAEQYYQRIIAEISSLRGEISVFGSQHLTSRQMDLVQAIVDHGLLLLLQQRSILAGAQHFGRKTEQISDTACNLLEHMAEQSGDQRERLWQLSRTINALLESTKQLKFLISSSMHLLENDEAVHWARDSIVQLDSYIGGHEQLQISRPILITDTHVNFVERCSLSLTNFNVFICNLREQSSSLGCLPSAIYEPCASLCSRAMILSDEFTRTQAKKAASAIIVSSIPDRLKVDQFKDSASKTINAALLAVQTIVKEKEKRETRDEEQTLLDVHSNLVSTSVESLIKRIYETLSACMSDFRVIEDEEDFPCKERELLFKLMNDVGVLCSHALEVFREYVAATEKFHRECCKLNYILLRVFRVLVAKGFCSDEVNNDGDAQDADEAGGTFADDQDGTGMGEGEGRNDVTDQIENEDQLLGLKNDANEESKGEDGASKQLEKEEAEKGMEMEGDFEGEMYDVPQEEEEGTHDDENDKEELDREMGDGNGDNEDVIDEKLWGESDNEEDENGEEKFEKNSSVKGESASDEMMTRDENEKEKTPEDDGKSNDDKNEKNVEIEKDENGESDDVNCDFEDNYEENHGIDVRANDIEKEGQDDIDDEMIMEDQLSLGNEEDEENEGAAEEEDANNEILNEADKSDDQSIDGSTGTDESQIESSLAVGDKGEENEDEPIPEDPQDRKDHIQHQEQHKESKSGLGVQNIDGRDNVQGEVDESGPAENEQEAQQNNEGEASGNETNEASNDGGNGTGKTGQASSNGDSKDNKDQSISEEFPNPLKSPGDASKFWFKKLNVIQSHDSAEDEMETGQETSTDDRNQSGEFEYTDQDQMNTTQTLGNVEEKEEMLLDDKNEEKGDDSISKKPGEGDQKKETDDTRSRKNNEDGKDSAVQPSESQNDSETSEDMDVQAGDDQSENQSIASANMDYKEDSFANIVVSDLSRMHVSNNQEEVQKRKQIVADEQTTDVCSEDMARARARWSQIQSETNTLSRRLCEKLRLVMEPLVASKLRGDYRTGKRINMKRVISYIASGYRKDKIWLRRTKPAKRNYRVLLAVDDSESMLKGGAGEMALRAMATLLTGMSQLEVGEVGVASFGEDMKLVHEFNLPFTAESGVNIVQNFQFDQQRTRTAFCVESALAALESPGDNASMQLVFLISDGRIERDSKDALRRLIREMMERNILLAMIVVEGGEKKESILNMKEVSFEKGNPKVTHFMEDYPFPYYILLEDIQTLPEVLGDVLRQWFEMLAHLQKGES